MTLIVNTQDEELAISEVDERGRVPVFVRLGEPNHIGSAEGTIYLDKKAVVKMINTLRDRLIEI